MRLLIAAVLSALVGLEIVPSISCCTAAELLDVDPKSALDSCGQQPRQDRAPSVKLWEWEKGFAVESLKEKEMAVYLWFYLFQGSRDDCLEKYRRDFPAK